MDPELERRIQAARAQGYSDEEIQAALGRTNAAATVPSRVESTAEVPVLSSEERLRLKQEEVQEQMRQQEVTGPSENTTMAAGAAMGAAALGVPAALYYGGKAILSPAAQATADLAQRGVAAAENIGKTMAETEARVGKRPGFGNVPKGAPGPIAPGAAPQIINPATGQPFAATAPAAAPAQAAPQTMLDKTTQMMKQIAANKVLQNTLRLGGAAAFAAQPSDLGPAVPQKGQFRGMEINPMTRRPWTREELAALNR